MAGHYRKTIDTKKVTDSLYPAAAAMDAPIAGRDRVHRTRRLLVGIMLLVGFCLASITLDSVFRARTKVSVDISLYRALGYPYPALVPSGRILRHPDFDRTGVDLRFIPSLPGFGTDPALLIMSYQRGWMAHEIAAE